MEDNFASETRSLEDPSMARPLRRRKPYTKPRAKPKHEENDFSCAVNKLVKNNFDPEKVVAYAVPNGDLRDPIVAVRLKAQGVKRGVYDWHFHWRNGAFPRTGVIELKVNDNDRSEEQEKFGKRMDEIGHLTAVCWCMSEVEGTLDGWGVPRKTVVCVEALT